MVDFRYHLVSLVAVFIALAVGIVLGAGPLREGISETLDEEVAQLRTERTELRNELATLTARAAAKDEALELVGGRAVAGTLSGSRVAVLTLPGADRNRVAGVEERVDEAGGALVLRADLDDDWERAVAEEDVAALVTELSASLALPEPREGDAPTLATVVAATLAGSDQDTQVGAWLGAGDRLEEQGLLDLTWQEGPGAQITDRRPPDVLLVVGGGLGVLAQDPEDEQALAALETRLDLIDALAALELPTLVAAPGTETDPTAPSAGTDPLVVAVRDDNAVADTVSTVDNLESSAGVLASTLGLAWELQQETGHYGLGDGAQAPVPAPPPQRLVTSPVPGDGAGVTEPVPDDAATTTSP